MRCLTSLLTSMITKEEKSLSRRRSALPYGEVLNAEEWMLTGWTAVVQTDLGTLEIK